MRALRIAKPHPAHGSSGTDMLFTLLTERSMTLTRIAAITLAALSIAASGSAALSSQYTDWGKGPVQHMMTKAELAQWKTITTDADAQAFIDLFWARRDPTPGTPANETKVAFEERVQIADQRYGGRTRGSLTDRGRTFILLGAPTRMRSSGAPGSLVPSAGGGFSMEGRGAAVTENSPKELWIYEQAKTPVKLDGPTAELAFVDQYRSNEFKLEATTRTNYSILLQHAAEWYITQPNLTAVPAYAAAGTTGSTGAAITPTPSKSASLSATVQAAIDEIRAGKAQPTKNAFVSYGEFITPEGDYFVPVSLYVPKVAGLDPAAKYSFFGLVEKDGTTAVMFEDPVKTTASGEDFFVDKSLTTLGPGKYKATFGLAQDGKPVSIVTTDLEVDPLDKSAPAVSDLLLSTNIYALSAAQAPTDPFAFGGMKVVPKPDRAFRKSEELWYFFVVRNPGVDAATKKPKISVQMTLSGRTTAGQNVKMNGAAAEADVTELRGVQGQYAVGASFPLAKFRAGDYTMTLKATDLVTNQAYELKQTFTVAE
jgi:GWxTD domain-containing protein